MNIYEAAVVAEVINKGRWIRREGWCDGHAIMLTDNPKTAMVMITPNMIQPRWDLCTSDLVATDWDVVESEYKKMEEEND